MTKEAIGGGLIAVGLILGFIDLRLRLKFISLSLGAVLVLVGIWVLVSC